MPPLHRRFLRILAAVLFVALGGAPLTPGQEPAKKHHVVVEVTASTAGGWRVALNGVENLRKTLGSENTEVEVVAHVNGVNLLVAKDNSLVEQLQKLADAGVVFAACQNSMHAFHLTAADLVPFARPVDAGVAEVVRKEEAGWSLLKYGN